MVTVAEGPIASLLPSSKTNWPIPVAFDLTTSLKKSGDDFCNTRPLALTVVDACTVVPIGGAAITGLLTRAARNSPRANFGLIRIMFSEARLIAVTLSELNLRLIM